MNGYEQMREALKHCIEELQPYCDGVARIDDVLEEAQAALALPRRQCDVGTAEEQMERFREFCRQEKCGRYRCGWDCKATCIERCAIDWAQTPYEYEAQEGGAE